MNTRVALIRIAAKNEGRGEREGRGFFFLRAADWSLVAASPRRVNLETISTTTAAPARLLGTPAGAMSTYVYVDGEDAFARGRAGGRMAVQRRTVDYTATTVRHVEVRARARWRSRARKATSRQTINP